MKSRRSLGLVLTSTLLVAFAGCATAISLPDEDDAVIGDGDGDGDDTTVRSGGAHSSGGATASGGNSRASGGAATHSGGASSSGGGSSTSGGTNGSGASSSSGGANLGGAENGAGGAHVLVGDCAETGTLANFAGVTGELAVYVCREDRDSCRGVALNEPALFECISNHPPNCHVQEPEGSGTTWQFVAMCSDTSMGGAAGSSGI